MRTLLKVHEDVHTVPEAIGKMVDAYAAEGYQVERLSSMNFKITLQGGWVHIFWEDGRIWQEIIEEKEDKDTAESAKALTDAKPTKKENEQARRQQEVKQPSNGADILDDLVVKIVPLLVKGATEALQIPKYGGAGICHGAFGGSPEIWGTVSKGICHTG